MQRSLLALAIASLGVSNVNALTFTVTEENDNGLANTPGTLSYAIRQANDPNGHASREDGSKGPDIIEFQTDITVTAPMLALIDSDINIVGNGHTLSGGKLHRPLFVKSGSVNISDLTIEDGLAKGQNTGSGGAGAGMGGGLFIYDGTVSLTSVAFKGNRAFGGTGRQYRTSTYYVGGGMQRTNPLAESRTDVYGDPSFGSSLFGDAGYGHKHEVEAEQASGAYGGQLTNADQPNGGFGAGGFSDKNGGNAGDGGFGAGGGYGYSYGDVCGDGNDYCGEGGNGGFGGGGGYGGKQGGNGGFGAAGGGAYYGQSYMGAGGFGAVTTNDRKDGAGMGGAIFVRSGHLSLDRVSFDSNRAHGGTNHPSIVEIIPGPIDPLLPMAALAAEPEPLTASGYGGALFVMHTKKNTNDNHQGMPESLPTVSMCNVTFGHTEETKNYAQSLYNEESTETIFDPTNKVTDLDGSFTLVAGEQRDVLVSAGQSLDFTLDVDQCNVGVLTWSVKAEANQGQVNVDADGNVSYRVNENATGNDSFTILVVSERETSREIKIDVSIKDKAVPPTDGEEPTSPDVDAPTSPDAEDDSNGSSGGGSLFWTLAALLSLIRIRRR